MCSEFIPGAHGSQTRVSDPLVPELQTTVNNNVHWELNPGSLQEQPVLITAESSLQSSRFYVAQAGL